MVTGPGLPALSPLPASPALTATAARETATKAKSERIMRGLVRCLVRRLNVDADEIVRLQRLDAVTALRGVVGVEVTGRPRHVDALPAQQDADAAHQIDGAEDRPALAVDLRERPQTRRLAL